MAVKIRLTRMGSKKRPSYRIVATDSRSPRDGKYLELIGFYNPITEPAEIKINEEVALKWLKNGAQPSDTVKNLLSKAGIMKKYAEEKLQKLNKYIEDSNEITGTILFKVYGPKQKIEVTIPLKSCTLRVEEEGADFYAIIDTSIDKLERQIRKNKTRIESKNKVYKSLSLDFEAETEEEEEHVVKIKDGKNIVISTFCI